MHRTTRIQVKGYTVSSRVRAVLTLCLLASLQQEGVYGTSGKIYDLAFICNNPHAQDQTFVIHQELLHHSFTVI